MKFADFRISTRLSAGFAALLVVMGGMTVSGVMELQNIGLATNTLTHETLGKERLATEWYTHTLTNSIRAMAVFEMHDPEAIKRIKAEMAETTKSIDANQEKMKDLLVSEEEKAIFEKVLDARKSYSAHRKLAMSLTDEAKKEEATAVINDKMLPALKNYVASIEAVKAMAQKTIDDKANAIEDSYISGRRLLIGLGLAGLILGALFAWRLSKGITRPINAAVDVARTVAGGDLTRNIVVDSKDETGILLQALKDMNESLRSTVTAVRDGTSSMQTAATEIATGNQDLSARTESQAGSLEETAAAIEELTSTVKQNAEHASHANRLANDASKIANHGGTVVTQVVDVMQSIEQSSKKIVDIISVIDGIAFQTNILALNAAVEAARAGEQGRGFAVVASEVRALAQRSAAAAKEIEGLIGESVSKVNSGSQLVNSAGSTMQEIVSSIAQVTTIVNEIAASSREQSIGIEQVNAAVVQMDGMTQQNAALVEEASAAAMELQQQSTALNALVSEFKV